MISAPQAQFLIDLAHRYLTWSSGGSASSPGSSISPGHGQRRRRIAGDQEVDPA